MLFFSQVKFEDINQSLSFELIAIVFFALMGLNLVLQVIDRFRAKPPAHEKYQTKEECEKKCYFYNERIDSMSSSSAGSREKIYNRLGKLEREMEGLKTESKNQNIAIQNLENKIDKQTDKIISIVKK